MDQQACDVIQELYHINFNISDDRRKQKIASKIENFFIERTKLFEELQKQGTLKLNNLIN